MPCEGYTGGEGSSFLPRHPASAVELLLADIAENTLLAHLAGSSVINGLAGLASVQQDCQLAIAGADGFPPKAHSSVITLTDVTDT